MSECEILKEYVDIKVRKIQKQINAYENRDDEIIVELEGRIEELEHEAKYGSIPTISIPINSTGSARVVTINDIDINVKVLEEQMAIRKRREQYILEQIAELNKRPHIEVRYYFEEKEEEDNRARI